MAFFHSSLPISHIDFNLSDLLDFEGFWDLLDNVNRTYTALDLALLPQPFLANDILRIWEGSAGPSASNFLIELMGTNLNLGPGGTSVTGTVTGFRISQPTLGVDTWFDYGVGFSVPLVDFWAAAESNFDSYDDFLIFEQMYRGSDTIIGSLGPHDDYIIASAGNDYVDGQFGNDIIEGADGKDTLFGGFGSDVLIGGAGADEIYGGEDDGRPDMASYYDANAGVRADLFISTYNVGHAFGDIYTQIEDLEGSRHADTLLGDRFANLIVGLAGSDHILGRTGNDTLVGDDGNDTLSGGDGVDYLVGGIGADLIDGGAGNQDQVGYADSAVGLRADLQVSQFNTGEAAGDTYLGIEEVQGSDFADNLLGDGGNNLLFGLSGTDLLVGRLGDDELFGGAGTDTLQGGNGSDTLYGGTGADHLDGGDGLTDTAAYYDVSAGLRADLQVTQFNTRDAAGDTYAGIENLMGSDFNDTLLGDGVNNLILGYDGNDLIYGRIGNDTLRGGYGNDTLLGGAGADYLDGGEDQADVASYLESAIGVRADLFATQFNTGFAAGDTFIQIEDLTGSNHADSLLGDSGRNRILGLAGNDLLFGRGGDDFLDGQDGNDILFGGDGNDTVYAIQGNDLLFGGAGNDTLTTEDPSGNHSLSGGAGNDTLDGGNSYADGATTYVFDTALGPTNIDTIRRYFMHRDTIHLDDAVFSALSLGALPVDAFVDNPVATTADHRILYDRENQRLLYDSDGTGDASAIHFANADLPFYFFGSYDFLII